MEEGRQMVSRDEILTIVKEHLMDNLEDELDEADFDPSKSMKDMGANSIDIVEVVSCTMRELKVKVPRSELADLANVDEFVDLLLKVANEKPED
jgi:acyl carrier protein